MTCLGNGWSQIAARSASLHPKEAGIDEEPAGSADGLASDPYAAPKPRTDLETPVTPDPGACKAGAPSPQMGPERAAWKEGSEPCA
jgi:hypothetical protein